MKLKNTIFRTGFIAALNNLLVQPIPVVYGFGLRKFTVEVNAKSKLFEESRMALVEQYAEKDTQGKSVIDEATKNYKITNLEDFNKEYLKLVEIEEDYSFEKFVLTKEEAKKVFLTTLELGLLEDIFGIE